MTAMRSPARITSPTATFTWVTVPAFSACTGISIFIYSTSTSVSPSPTESHSATTPSSTLATISARTSSAITTPFVYPLVCSPLAPHRTTTSHETLMRDLAMSACAKSRPKCISRGGSDGQARPEEARPQTQQGQPRQAAQRRGQEVVALKLDDRGAADLQDQALT